METKQKNKNLNKNIEEEKIKEKVVEKIAKLGTEEVPMHMAEPAIQNQEGEACETNPLARNQVTHLSPTRPRSQSMAAGSMSQIVRDNKRPRAADGSSQQDIQFQATLEKLYACSTELMSFLTVNRRTKSEIQTGIKDIHFLAESLRYRWGEMLEFGQVAKTRVTTKGTVDNESQTGQWDTAAKMDAATQTDENNTLNTEKEHTKELRNAVLKQLAENRTFDGFKSIIDLKWPEEVYTSTTIINKKELKNVSNNTVLIANPEIGKDDAHLRPIRLGFPEVDILVEGGLTDGRVEFATNQIETTTSNGGMETKSKTLFILPHKMDNSGICDIADLYTGLGSIKNTMEHLGTKSANLNVLGILDHDYLRKSLEFVFYGSGITLALLHAENNRKSKDKPELKLPSDRKKGTQIQKVLVKAAGRSYADLLKEVKGNLNLDEMGIKVRTIKKTTNQNIVFEVRGGRENATKLKEAIKEKTACEQVIIPNNEESVYLMDIDAEFTKESVTDELSRWRPNMANKQFRVVSLRMNRYGTQTAKIVAERYIATQMLAEKKIKIG